MPTKVYPRVMLKTASLVTNREGKKVIKISFPFNAVDLEKVRSIVDRTWHKEAKCWSCPLSISNIQSLMNWGFLIDDKLKEYLQIRREYLKKQILQKWKK